MSGYTKLFNSILGSTIWREPLSTRVVWITMLALADRDGTVEASIPGLAHFANVSEKQAEGAIASFLSPDKHSRTEEHEGRRIQAIDGGWRLLNFDKYQLRLSPEDIRERDRIRKQRYRERQNSDVPVGQSGTSGTCPTMSGDVPDVQHSDADVDSDADANAGNKGASAFSLPVWIPVESWEAFIEMRKKQRKAPTERAKAMLVGKLEALKKAGHSVKVSLDQSTINGWTDVYAPKPGTAHTQAAPIVPLSQQIKEKRGEM